MNLTDDMLQYIQDTRHETKQLIRNLCAIPAPSHHEEKRADFCRKWFLENGFENVSVDPALNVLVPVNVKDPADLTVIMAHTDTVFPDISPMSVKEEDGFLYSPGVTDDTANLAIMMICARYIKDHFPEGKRGILFVANSCEEGLGNLKGCRAVMDVYGAGIKEFITLDSNSMDHLVAEAVGSHRYKITVRTKGGHSFNHFGAPSAIQKLSAMIVKLYSIRVPCKKNTKTTYNAGMISGGTSVNTIAQQAEMMYEYRSNDKECLSWMKKESLEIINSFKTEDVEVSTELLGERPCGENISPEKFEPLKNRIKNSAETVLGIKMKEKPGSTDCNIPLSKGIPAICFGVCRGSGAHTREEKLELASISDGCRLLLHFLCCS